LDIYNSKDQVNLKISNNIFYTATIYAQIPNALRSGVSIEHNLFIAGTCSNPILSSGIGSTFYNCLNWNISNNIFYNMQGTPSSIVQNNLVYNNNITYSGTTLTSLPPSGSIGSGNLNNTDPLFTSVFTDCTLAPFLLDNLRLKSNSPAKNAGTDGTDIGPTGGSYPIYTATNQFLTGEPPIPQITSLNITGPSSVAVGNGSLQIQVKARKID
jgi:hypothetical protein